VKRRILVTAFIVSVIAHLSAVAVQKPGAAHTDTIRQMLTTLHQHEEFTGSVLVAKAGTVVYREAIASTPDERRKLLESPVAIASVSKTFTAMAVMILVEGGKLGYDDLIARHVKELDGLTPGVTLRHLLSHTSGIPDVGDLGIDRPGVLEADVISAIRGNYTSFKRPGTSYRYSNTGYILLAMAIENASGQTFDDFVRAAILDPLQMKSTRPDPAPRKAAETKGDGGFVSTVDDLLKWDRALAAGKLVSAKTFAEALVPAKVSEGTSTYGLGWNIQQRDGQPYIWHQGNSGGQRAFLGRRLADDITIVILTQGNSRRLEIADAIGNILHDRPYDPPKLSIARRLSKDIDLQSIDAILALYEQLRTSEAARYDFSEPELNGLGYTLLGKGRNNDAIRVFELNVRQFPNSTNVYDSLGDAFFQSGRKAEAIQAYSRVLALDPSNANARAMLQKLK
jgi:CubicO group peptidase (beta-lactamase class C family)